MHNTTILLNYIRRYGAFSELDVVKTFGMPRGTLWWLYKSGQLTRFKFDGRYLYCLHHQLPGAPMKTTEVDISLIVVPEDRQREDLGDIEELRQSIANAAKARGVRFQDGLINPILLSGLTLVAGQRRLEAHKLEGVTTIHTIDWADLPEEDRELLEYEENAKRQNLHWAERAKAVQRIHKAMQKKNPKWSAVDTTRYLGYKVQKGGKGAGKEVPAIAIQQALALDGLINDKLAKAPTLESAYNTVARVQRRAFADITNEILAGPSVAPVSDPVPKSGSSTGVRDAVLASGHVSTVSAPSTDKPTVSVEAVVQGDFLEWSASYSGPKFNFIHCDFPYGINIDSSDQMRHDNEKLYGDSEDIYWALCEAFMKNLDRFAYPSCHVMFWFSMEKYIETIQFFEKHSESTGLVWQRKPLVWHKSCGSGMVPDHRRRPRNTYEVALIGARQDRFIHKPVASSYSCPVASKRLHPSEKPVPMLSHFFEMFVDSETSMLDPTAGGGAALRAADAMGAKRLIGVELDPQFVAVANAELRKARALRKISEKLT